jgi:hypothetical protein
MDQPCTVVWDGTEDYEHLHALAQKVRVLENIYPEPEWNTDLAKYYDEQVIELY